MTNYIKSTASFTILMLFFLAAASAQSPVVGTWNGALELGSTQLRIVFHISEKDGKFSSTMDSPDQGAKGLPVGETTYKNRELHLGMPNMMAEYNAKLDSKDPNILVGDFTQRGQEFKLVMVRGSVEEEDLRPQEPKPPFKYYTEDVTFKNEKDGITLTGTLTKPRKRGKYRAVVLVSGSGPQDRNEEILGHKPFWVIADYLTKNGYAVLRYDDRGTAKSKGNFSTATTFDLAEDAKSAVSFLKTQKGITDIGIIGHSEGGLIAPIVASEMPDLAFIVLMAGPGVKGSELLLMQQDAIGRATSLDQTEVMRNIDINKGAFKIINTQPNLETATNYLDLYLKQKMAAIPDSLNPSGASDEVMIQTYLNQYTSPWMYNFIKTDPVVFLKEVSCPVLAINGSKDLQVPAKANLNAIEKALKNGNNPKATFIEFENLNHLFQECETGLPMEYGSITQTISPKVLEKMAKWMDTL